MNRLVTVFAMFFMASGATVHAQADRSSQAVVTVGPEESGNWQAAYSFEEPQKVLAFARSESDFRQATWSLQGEGAQFGRAGGVDVIVFEEPATEVSFSIIPLTSELAADYTPFVMFGDGSLAVYEGQFSLVPFDSLEAVEALDGDLSNAETGRLAMDVAVSSDKPIIADGEVYEDSLTHRIKGDGTYIFMGDSPVTEYENFTVILDGALPEWLRGSFATDLETVFAGLEERWGFGLDETATVMLAYGGRQGDGLTAKGGALDNVLMMQAGGPALDRPDFDTLSYLHWFFAHEAVHLFQRAPGAVFPDKSAAWIHEGAANTMAYGLIASMLGGEEGRAFLAGVYANAFERCVSALEEGPLPTAGERDAFQAHYACGDFAALASDGYLKRRNLYEFWTALTGRAEALDPPVVDARLYFTTLRLLGVTEARRDLIRAIVGGEAPEDPRAALTEMLETAGLAPEFNGKGQLIKLDWPGYAAE